MASQRLFVEWFDALFKDPASSEVPAVDNYTNTGNQLAQKIQDLIPTHPQILIMEDPFLLTSIPELQEAIQALQPSMGQAQWALGHAKAKHRDTQGKDGPR